MANPACDLVVGGDGLIGRHLSERLRLVGRPVLATSRRATGGETGWLHLDLSKPISAAELPDRVRAAYLLAAVTSMAACEADRDGTRRINTQAILELAGLLRQRGAHLVLVSTNLVTAGDRPRIKATDAMAPQNAYAAQKLEAEERLLAEGGASVLRITKIVEGLEPLLTQWAAKLRSGQIIEPFSDLICAPITLGYVVDTVIRLADQRLEGTFQVSSDRDIGYDDIAQALARRLGADPSLVQPTRSDLAGVKLAACPKHTTLELGPDRAGPRFGAR